MLGLIFNGFLLTVNLLLRGGSNVWIPSNVRPLGCYSPFNFQAVIANSDGTEVGLSECFMCYTNFTLLRGVQCLCLEDRRIAELIRVNDSYCDIRCDDNSQPSNVNSSFMCGGNLGANLYCNKQAGNICHANPNQPAVEIYREFDKNQGNGFELMVPCLEYGCGQPGFNDKYHLEYIEYFPNLNPEDCVIYCTYMKTSYAHVGWNPAGNKLYPACVCSNATGDPYLTGPPCVQGTCPSALNPMRFNNRDDGYLPTNGYLPSCGNKDLDDPYWSIFCTTAIVKEPNETQCAAFQTPFDSSWDTCPTSSTSTQKASSSSLTTQPPQNTNCPSHSKSSILGSYVKLWEMLDVGSCSNNSRVYNRSCYFIESLSENEMENVDVWRNASSNYCNKHNHGHLLAIETENEKNFITGEFLSAGFDLKDFLKMGKNILEEDEGLMRPYLTSGVKTSQSTEFWSLANNAQIPMSNMSGWGVELLSCEEEYPSYLMLYYNMETQGYSSWEFTRFELSRYFICEYAEPENNEITSPSTTSSTTPTTTFSTTSTTTRSTTPTSTTTPSTTLSSTISPSTTPPTATSTTQSSSTPSTMTVTSSTPSTPTSTTTPIRKRTTTESVVDNTTPPTMETTQVTTSTTTSTLVPESSYKQCPCVGTDIYHSNWTIPANTTKHQQCRPGAIGMASWACGMNANGCYFRTTQPNFSDCSSKELREIANDVDNYDTELSAVWDSLSNFTQPNDLYFGHEIEYILGLIVDLLDRQDEQMNNTINHLEFQINTTRTGAHILDNLISHDMQWDQLNQVNRSQTALILLNVSEDMSFRLTDVAEVDGRSLRCEINLSNVSLSSSYWDGGPNDVHDCYLNTMAASNVFQQFPLPGQSYDSTYILLPEEAIAVGRTHKAAGLLISHYILQQLFPGQNSVAGDEKQINSPLISYSLRNEDGRNLWKSGQIPENSFVQIVYKHALVAKDPPVQIIHRELNPGEIPSPVIGSAFCAFLSFYESSNDTDRMAWIWDDRGCSLISTNRTHTLCKCSHLTGFSTLMDFHDYAGESRPLEITSIVCSMASAISLAITFTVLTILRSIKTDRTIITQHLCIFLMISHILALTTLDRHYLKLDDVTCAAMGVTLHFCLLVSFMWMGIEGVRLCRMVIYVFNLYNWTLYYILAANIVPFIIVGSTILAAYCTTGIIPAYVGDETCWLNGDNYKWSFAGPVVVIIIANVLFAVIAVRSSWNLKQNIDRSLEEKIRNAAALSLSLTCLLGISWLTGFFLYMETQVFEYIFTITNGLQGVTIMLFRCVFNDEVSTAIKERWRRHKSNRLGKWSSTMTNNTNSQHRKSVADTDNNPRVNKKLTQTNSRLSTLSNATKTTDVTYASSTNIHRPERTHRKNNIRTFSGTEFSETEYSSEARGSFSSTGSYRHNLGKQQESAGNSGARESRRVSFFFQEHTLPSTSISPDIPEEISEHAATSRRTRNLTFYKQDPSVFF